MGRDQRELNVRPLPELDPFVRTHDFELCQAVTRSAVLVGEPDRGSPLDSVLAFPSFQTFSAESRTSLAIDESKSVDQD